MKELEGGCCGTLDSTDARHWKYGVRDHAWPLPNAEEVIWLGLRGVRISSMILLRNEIMPRSISKTNHPDSTDDDGGDMRLLRHVIRLTLLWIVSSGVMYGGQNANARIPVVLSTDVGNEIDDQWAITYLLLQPRFDVLGVMSAHAPTITAPAGRTSYRILVDVGSDYRLPWGGISASQNKIRRDPVEVEKFLRAVLRGVRAISDPQNKTDVTHWVGKFFKLEDKLADEFYRRLVPSLNPSGLAERDKIKLIIDSAVERGLTDKPLDPDAVVDFSIVRQLRF